VTTRLQDSHTASPTRFATPQSNNDVRGDGVLSGRTIQDARPILKPKRSVRSRKYLNHYPISSLREAKVLSKPSSWEILDVIRAAGVHGTSASEITKMLNLPQSDVYACLKELVDIQSITQLRKDMKPKDERKRLYVYEKTNMRKYDVDKTIALITKELCDHNELEGLRVPFFAMLAMVHDELQSRGYEDILPNKDPEWFCQQCEANHEAVEFFQAVALAMIRALTEDSTHFKRLLGRLGYQNNIQHSRLSN
jgi:DNA-binding MarR family transcriptional regulator